MVSQDRYITIEQLRLWAGEPVARWRTVGDAGDRSHRYVRVAPMGFYILTINGGYETDVVTPFPHKDDALAAAERIMAEPDPRGLMREWEIDTGQSRPYKHSGFSYGRPRPSLGTASSRCAGEDAVMALVPERMTDRV